MLSIYTFCFNVIKNNFDYQDAILNYSNFADEVVININQSEDNTLEAITHFIKNFSNVKIVSTNFQYSDWKLTPKCFNSALEATTEPIKIGLCLDERVPLWQKDLWYKAGDKLLGIPQQSFFIHFLDLFKTPYTTRNSMDITKVFRWAIHKNNCKRGPVNFGIGSHGFTNGQSDCIELIDNNGNLVSSCRITIRYNNLVDFFKQLPMIPFIFHLGHVDLKRKERLFNNFWKEHWKLMTGYTIEPVNINTTELEKTEIIYHNLKLWNEK